MDKIGGCIGVENCGGWWKIWSTDVGDYRWSGEIKWSSLSVSPARTCVYDVRDCINGAHNHHHMCTRIFLHKLFFFIKSSIKVLLFPSWKELYQNIQIKHLQYNIYIYNSYNIYIYIYNYSFFQSFCFSDYLFISVGCMIRVPGSELPQV